MTLFTKRNEQILVINVLYLWLIICIILNQLKLKNAISVFEVYNKLLLVNKNALKYKS